MSYLGYGRWPLDTLWRKDLRDAFVVVENGIPVRKWYQGPFTDEDDAHIERVYMSLCHPTKSFYVQGISGVTLTECQSIANLIWFKHCEDEVNNGNEPFKTMLAICYAWGHGVNRNIQLANRLLAERITLGDKDASHCREILERTMFDGLTED